MTFWMPKPGMMAAGAGGGAPFEPVLRSQSKGTYPVLTRNITLPPTVGAGDLLLIQLFRAAADGSAAPTIPAWTTIAVVHSLPVWQQGWYFAKVAVGNEDGTVVTVTGTATASSYNWVCYSIDLAGAGAVYATGTGGANTTGDALITRMLTGGDPAFWMGRHNSTGPAGAPNDNTVLLSETLQTVQTFIGHKKTLGLSGNTEMGFAATNEWGGCIAERNIA